MEIFYYLHDTPGAYAIAAVAAFGHDGGATLLAKALDGRLGTFPRTGIAMGTASPVSTS